MSRLGIAAQLAAAAPVGREEARQAAERELSKAIYHENEPTVLERLADRVMTWISDLLDRMLGATPGGGLGLLVVTLLVVALVAVVLWRVGPMRRQARGSAQVLDESGPTDPDEHRRRADAHAADGRWDEAVRERMRAIVRELETRGVLEPRPGRTADEIARDAGRLVPGIAADLRTAASVFDEVWFGGRPADARADSIMRQADDRIRRTRLAVADEAVPATGFQVPR